MKCINQMVLLSIVFGLVVGLTYSPISLQPLFAMSPDPCFGKHSAGCPNMSCKNYPETLTATCCWTDIHDGELACQTCWVNTDTGEFENCSSTSIGGSDSSVVAPPPSGKAPPPSTEKCPDNSAMDSKGNCTPMTQLLEDSSNDNNDDKKPQFPRGNILGELQSNSELPPQS
jgi:hypothetical protein